METADSLDDLIDGVEDTLGTATRNADDLLAEAGDALVGQDILDPVGDKVVDVSDGVEDITGGVQTGLDTLAEDGLLGGLGQTVTDIGEGVGHGLEDILGTDHGK